MKWSSRWGMVVSLLALVLLSGCSRKEARIQFSVQKHFDNVPHPSVRVTFRSWSGLHEVHLDSTHQMAGPFATGKSGSLVISFWVLSDEGASTTSGSLELPLREDWGWGVQFVVSSEDPSQTCFGCMGSKSYELDPVLGYDEDKRFYVIWGGNSISNPVVY